MRFLAWILGVLLALGAGGAKPKETDEELRNKIQSHIDTIVDEGAAIVDDVAESLRGNESLQEAEKFIQDVIDVAEACGTGRSEEARNILIDILARPEKEAKIAAIKGLGALRYDPDSQTEALRHCNPGNDPELAELIKASIDALRDFTRESKK